MVVLDLVVTLLLAAGLAALSVLVLYMLSLALAYFVGENARTAIPLLPRSRFAFVVPAHDEECGIEQTVASLSCVAYPSAMFEVVVVADNCTDATAARAQAAGARVLERADLNNKGKGYALHHAFSQLLPEGHDAFIIIDADSVVSDNFLQVLDARLRAGEQVVQAYYGIANPDASILTYLFQVGNLIENKLYWEPKQRLGLPVFLRGNGMCFARAILEKYPWDAFSITEDTEFGLMLVEEGIRVNFASEMGVFAQQPETFQQAFAQRVRWAAGNSTLTKGRALQLLARGVVNREPASFDLGMSLLVASRPLLLVVNLLLGLLCALWAQAPLFYWAASLFVLQLFYLWLGIILNGLSPQNLLRILLSPFYLSWLCVISLMGAAGFRNNQWVRTSRK